MSTRPECCPACGRPLFTTESFRWHLETIRGDEAHTAALWSLLGVDYQTLKAEGGGRVEERAQHRGWRLL
jgi:hypothetical protein